MRSNKLQRWYRNSLSGYLEAMESGKLYENDIDEGDLYIPVPLLKPENIGAHMAIDEKHIDNEYYTILSNKESGKIALLAQTTKASEIAKILAPYSDNRMNVRTISRDLAPNYDWVCRENFMNAIAIADKFHIVKIVQKAVQDQRVEYRHIELSKKRMAYDEHKVRQEEKRLAKWREGKKYKKQKYKSIEPRCRNGETKLQLLQRSRTLLFKSKSQWNKNQKIRAEVLFENYPEIQHLYNLSQKFRNWMSKKNIGKSRLSMEKKIREWFNQVDNLENLYMINAKSSIEKNLGVIMNYFYEGATNAKAENLNRHIKRFIGTIFGIREMDFFFYRLGIYFS